MSAMTTSPQCASPGGNTSGALGTPSVTVSVASMCGPGGSALSAESPDGRSIETTGRSAALMSATTVSKSPDSGVFSPVPKSASTSRSQPRISEKCSSQSGESLISTIVWPRLPRISRFVRASPRTSATEPTRNVDTSTPRCSSVRATTNPSPPLLPRPQSTAILSSPTSENIASIAATTWRPAFSISTTDGMPTSSTVRRSTSRICALFRIRMDVASLSLRPRAGGCSDLTPLGPFELTHMCPLSLTQSSPEVGSAHARRGLRQRPHHPRRSGSGAGVRSRLPVRRRRVRSLSFVLREALHARSPPGAPAQVGVVHRAARAVWRRRVRGADRRHDEGGVAVAMDASAGPTPTSACCSRAASAS